MPNNRVSYAIINAILCLAAIIILEQFALGFFTKVLIMGLVGGVIGLGMWFRMQRGRDSIASSEE